jgi:hypothetical protein
MIVSLAGDWYILEYENGHKLENKTIGGLRTQIKDKFVGDSEKLDLALKAVDKFIEKQKNKENSK